MKTTMRRRQWYRQGNIRSTTPASSHGSGGMPFHPTTGVYSSLILLPPPLIVARLSSVDSKQMADVDEQVHELVGSHRRMGSTVRLFQVQSFPLGHGLGPDLNHRPTVSKKDRSIFLWTVRTLVVHYWTDLQSVHRFRCYGNMCA